MLTQQKVRDVKLILDKCPSLQELYLVKVMDASHGWIKQQFFCKFGVASLI